MKRMLSLLLGAFLLLTSLTFTSAFAAEAYTPEVGDGYIRHDASKIFAGTVNNMKTCTIEKNVTFEGKNAMKISPNPTAEDCVVSTGLNLDCYSLSTFSTKIEMPRYKYVGITYYYQTNAPSFTGKPQLLFLNTEPKGALGGQTTVYASNDVVTNKWTQAVFAFPNLTVKEGLEGAALHQIHYRMFPGIDPENLKETDVFYLADVTFYDYNPDPNAMATIEFEKGSPDAVGETEPLVLKPGETYTMPKPDFITFAEFDATFLGWKDTVGGKVYQPGDVVTATDVSVVYNAQWDVVTKTDFVSLSFPDYANGTVNNQPTGTLEKVTIDGRSAIKAVPDPGATVGKKFTIDGFSYSKASIDLKAFKWIGIEYKYVSENPVDAKMYTAIMNQKNIFKPAIPGIESVNKIVTNQWTTAWFDYTIVDEYFNPDGPDTLLRQMHLRPFGSADLNTFSATDTMYISRIMFFKEKPDLVEHAAYMTGYNDATFKPNKTMTRAEACTVVARLLDTEENIAKSTATAFTDVTADKWYAKYVAFCEAKGLLKSYSGTFEPEKDITRAEFAELVYNMGLAKEDAANAKTFTDVTTAHPKYAAIMAAASAGLIGGYEDGTFLPDRTITRAQVVTIINRAKGTSKTADMISSDVYTLFLDVDGSHWAFADIAEATVGHIELDGKWTNSTTDPVAAILEKVDTSVLMDTKAGNAKVKELDALEAKRIEEIRNTPSMDLSHIKGTKYYVSSSTGSDENDGKSEASPFKTLKRAVTFAKTGDAILLKRGDLWRERISPAAGITMTAYGTGAKPIISGSPENGADPEKWSLVYKNDQTGAKIWKYANEEFNDIGNIVFTDSEGVTGYGYKELPSHDGTKYIVRGSTGTAFDYTTALDRNFEYFHAADSYVNANLIQAGSSIGPIYLRCDNGNPGDLFESIEFSMRGNTIFAKSNTTIDNICIMFAGSHGIGMGTVENVKFTNLELGWIGGSIQHYNSNGSATRFGNGIEVFGGCYGYTIDNCYIWQNYDAGVTHQYTNGASGGNDVVEMFDITYSNNVIVDTVYSVEYFLGAFEGKVRAGKNVLIENNLMRRAGFGFGSTRPDGHNQGHIRAGGGTNPFENYVIRNNIFDRSMHFLVQTETSHKGYLPAMQGNTYIQGIDNLAFNFGVPQIGIYANIGIMGRLSGYVGDKTGKFCFVENIPYYTYSFDYKKTSDKQYPVVEDKSGTDEYVPDEDEEILPPYFVRTAIGQQAKDTKTQLSPAFRASMQMEIKVDPETGYTYMNIIPLNLPNTMLFDAFGLNPEIAFKDGKACIKALVRTNKTAKPTALFYQFKDTDGNKN